MDTNNAVLDCERTTRHQLNELIPQKVWTDPAPDLNVEEPFPFETSQSHNVSAENQHKLPNETLIAIITPSKGIQDNRIVWTNHRSPLSSPSTGTRPRKKICLYEASPDSVGTSQQPHASSAITPYRVSFYPNPKLDNAEKYLEYVEVLDPYVSEQDTERKKQFQAYTNTPIFTLGVSAAIEANIPYDWPNRDPIPQFGLLGIRQEESAYNLIDNFETECEDQVPARDQLIMANLNVPWSAFICGSQGAGKSHTLSCLLESGLLEDNNVGALPNPLAGLVCHYDTYTNATSTQLCEAAYLCSSGIPVTILVAPSNIWTMTQVYKNLPGLPEGSPKPKVLPLYLKDSQLDITNILKLMAVDPMAEKVPLYMEIVMRILREMAMEGLNNSSFSFVEFCRRLKLETFDGQQTAALSLRLQLLESFLEPSAATKTTRPARALEDIWSFKPGSLTIVDLSDPFVSSNDACSLFSICLSIFMEKRGECGRIVALDEAHKFLHQTGEAKVLTADLTSIIRQQRHTGTRVVIATQEPTLAPELIDLANTTIVHRFSSPAWYEVLKKHLAGASTYNSCRSNPLFETIVALEPGEALLFCPTAMVSFNDRLVGSRATPSLGDGFIKIRVRQRLTADGGRSITAADNKSAEQTLVVTSDIPMHIVTKVKATVTPQGPQGPQGQTNIAVKNNVPGLPNVQQVNVGSSTGLSSNSTTQPHSTTLMRNSFRNPQERRIYQQVVALVRRRNNSGLWLQPNKATYNEIYNIVSSTEQVKQHTITGSSSLVAIIKEAVVFAMGNR